MLSRISHASSRRMGRVVLRHFVASDVPNTILRTIHDSSSLNGSAINGASSSSMNGASSSISTPPAKIETTTPLAENDVADGPSSSLSSSSSSPYYDTSSSAVTMDMEASFHDAPKNNTKTSFSGDRMQIENDNFQRDGDNDVSYTETTSNTPNNINNNNNDGLPFDDDSSTTTTSTTSPLNRIETSSPPPSGATPPRNQFQKNRNWEQQQQFRNNYNAKTWQRKQGHYKPYNKNKNNQKPDPTTSSSSTPLRHQFKNERMTVAQHLDPTGKTLPTSSWIHVDWIRPTCSMEEVIRTFESFLRGQSHLVIDLDAEWNPHDEDNDSVPLLSIPDDSFIEAAHVLLSPFGRPNGWHIKFPNRSMVHTILTEAKTRTLYVNWKPIRVSEHQYEPLYQHNDGRRKPRFNNNKQPRSMHTDFVVNDSMIRIENAPPECGNEYIRNMMSRYDLAPEGQTVLRWNGRLPNGTMAPVMHIVRFASPAWARAAVRELQSTEVNGQEITLIQYPKQMRFDDAERLQARNRGWWRPNKPTGNKDFYIKQREARLEAYKRKKEKQKERMKNNSNEA